MHDRTAALAERVRSSGDQRTRLETLKDAYEGCTVVVVSCGPSLGDYDPEMLKLALSGLPVIAVKQAIDVVGDQADLLCFNSFNVRAFDPPSTRTIRVFQRQDPDRWPQCNPFDIELIGESHEADLSDSLAATGDFDRYLFEATTTRPWGPGIMYELVLHLALHLGASRVVTIGWDIAAPTGTNAHFYDGGDEFYTKSRAEAYKLGSLRRLLPDWARRGLRRLRAQQLHRQSRVYNRTLMLPGEAEVTAAATGSAAAWLERHGVEIVVASPSDAFDSRIHRIGPQEALQLLTEIPA